MSKAIGESQSVGVAAEAGKPLNDTTQPLEKVGAVVVRNGTILAVRKHSQPSPEFFMAGGKIEPGENRLQALVRELREEVELEPSTIDYLGTFHAMGVFEHEPITIHAYLISVTGRPVARSEIKEVRWINPIDPDIPISSVLLEHVIPELQRRSIIPKREQASVAPVSPTDALPPPFAWCEIPAPKREETPALSPALWIARYPTTSGQFQRFIDDPEGYCSDRWWLGLGSRPASAAKQAGADRQPRVLVNWYEAVAYCRWLSFRIGYTVRLPTEGEWEASYSGSPDHAYPWGRQFRLSWCNTREAGIGGSLPVDATPIGQGPSGVCDMAGNVWERCLGRFEDSRQIDVFGTYNRVIRGGSWRYTRHEARRNYRQLCRPDRRFDDGGFRIVAE